MNTELDKLIGHLEAARRKECPSCDKRVKAQVAPAIGTVKSMIDMLRTAGPIGMAIASAAMAVLWGVQEGPKLAKALSDLMAGRPTTLSLTEEQQIQQAIAAAQAKTVAEFKAGTQNDYGLSFTGAQNPAGDLGVQGFAGAQEWDNMSAETMALWEEATSANPGNPCNYLGQKLIAKNDKLAVTKPNRPFGQPSVPISPDELSILLEEISAIKETIRRMCGGQWGWDWGEDGINYGGKLTDTGFVSP